MKLERALVYHSVNDFSRSLPDAFCDVFTHPEYLILYQPDPGNMAGYMQDRRQIATYFCKAVGNLMSGGAMSGNTEKQVQTP